MALNRRFDRELGISGYDWPGAGFLPSVTALLGRCWPSPELEQWKLRQVAKAWRDGDPLPENKSAAWSGSYGLNRLAQTAIPRSAADRGTAIHQAVHQLITGEDVGSTKEQRLVAGRVLEAMHQAGYIPKMSEFSVASPEEGWCGTIDFAGRFADGVGWVGDLKTGKITHVEHWMQLAAYASASVLEDGRPFPSVGQVVLVHAPVKGKVETPFLWGDPAVIALEMDDTVFDLVDVRWKTLLALWHVYSREIAAEFPAEIS